MAPKKPAPRPKRPAANAAAASDDANGGAAATDDTPPATPADVRTTQLAIADEEGDDDPGPANAREYFARCNRPPTAAATIDDVCNVLEAFGYSDVPAGHATPHALR